MSDKPWLDGAIDVRGTDAEKKATVQQQGDRWEPAKQPSYYGNVAGRAAADVIGGVFDAAPRAYELGKAAIGSASILPGQYGGERLTLSRLLGKITGKPATDFLPEVQQQDTVTNLLKSALGVENQVAPESRDQALYGQILGGAVSGGLTPIKGLSSIAKSVLQNAAVGGVAGGAGEIASQASGGNPYVSIPASLIAGTALPSSMLRQGTIVGPANAAYQVAKDAAMTKTGPIVDKLVNSQLRQAVSGTPNAAENITEALALRGKIPGFTPSVAEMAGSEGALRMQQRYALSRPETLNAEIARMEGNKKAIADYYSSIAPEQGSPSTVRSAVNQSMSDAEKSALVREQGIAGQLPKADQLSVGERLSTLAEAEKTAAKPAIAAAYQKAYDLAPDAVIDAKPIIGKIEETLGVPLAQIKPETAPNTFNAIKRYVSGGEDKSPQELEYLASTLGGNIANPNAKVAMTLQDMADLRKAVNADAALASRSADPLAATRLRNIASVKSTIDEAIDASPIAKEAKDAFIAANQKYATEYAPRFKEGLAGDVFKNTAKNEDRILPDKFVSSFFAPDAAAGVTKSSQFGKLFGNNDEAKGLAKTGILDIYRQKVVNPTTGIIDQTAHNNFLRDYGRTLDQFEKSGISAKTQIQNIGSEAIKARIGGQKIEAVSKELKFDNVDDLVESALKNKKVMMNVLVKLPEDSRSTMTRMVMDKAMESGTGAGIAKFLSENESTLKMIPGMKESHINNLKDISKAMQIAERAPLKGAIQSGGTDVLKNMTGVSTATVYSQFRAVTGGRQAPVTMAFNIATPVLTKLGQTQFTEIMETALHDQKTAVNLRNFLMSTTPEATASTGKKLLDSIKDAGTVIYGLKGPILKHVVGLQRYPENAARSVLPIQTQIQESAAQQNANQ